MTIPGANAARSSSTEPGSASTSTTGRGSKARDASAGSAVRRTAWSTGSTAGAEPLSSDSTRLAVATAAASSSTTTSSTPLAACTSTGPISSGAYRPSPPPSTIAGPPMPTVAVRVATTTSHSPSSAALPAKHRPPTIPTRGTTPARPAHSPKLVVCSPVTTGWSVSPGRPPPPSANSTVGTRSRRTTSRNRSVFRCPTVPCVPASTP